MEELLALVNRILAIPKEELASYTPEQRARIKNFLSKARAKLQAVQIPQGADLLYTLAGGNPQAFQSYLENFPNAALNKLASNPSALQNVLARLGSQVTFPSGEVKDGVPKADLQSSNVYGFQYDPRSSKLRVRFQGGSVYDYDGVPPAIFKMFAAGAIPAKTNGGNRYGYYWVGKKPSLGASVNGLLKLGGFSYNKVR